MRKSIDQAFKEFMQARADGYIITDPEYKKAQEEERQAYKELKNLLNDDLQKKLLAYDELYTRMLSLAVDAYYREGFRDAVQLLMKSMG